MNGKLSHLVQTRLDNCTFKLLEVGNKDRILYQKCCDVYGAVTALYVPIIHPWNKTFVQNFDRWQERKLSGKPRTRPESEYTIKTDTRKAPKWKYELDSNCSRDLRTSSLTLGFPSNIKFLDQPDDSHSLQCGGNPSRPRDEAFATSSRILD
jgi:hypothetical protein